MGLRNRECPVHLLDIEKSPTPAPPAWPALLSWPHPPSLLWLPCTSARYHHIVQDACPLAIDVACSHQLYRNTSANTRNDRCYDFAVNPCKLWGVKQEKEVRGIVSTKNTRAVALG